MRPGIALASSTWGPSASRIRSTRAKPVQPSASVGGERRLGDRAPLVLGELGRADEVGAADLVARLEVVAVAIGRDRLDHRQRLVAEHADRQLAALDEALEQHPVVVAEGGDQCLRDLARRWPRT